MNRVRWYVEDGAHYGWTSEQDMNHDEPTFLIEAVEPFVFACWALNENGHKVECISGDHPSASAVKRELGELL